MKVKLQEKMEEVKLGSIIVSKRYGYALYVVQGGEDEIFYLTNLDTNQINSTSYKTLEEITKDYFEESDGFVLYDSKKAELNIFK